MSTRSFAADDFDAIRKRQEELFPRQDPNAGRPQTVPPMGSGHKWSGSSPGGMHCTHCPRQPDETCPDSCRLEAIKKGLLKDGDDWPPSSASLGTSDFDYLCGLGFFGAGWSYLQRRASYFEDLDLDD